MRLSDKAIKEFKEIYQREFGKPISDEKAQELGQNLIALFKIIYRPLPTNQNKNEEENAYSDDLGH